MKIILIFVSLFIELCLFGQYVENISFYDDYFVQGKNPVKERHFKDSELRLYKTELLNPSGEIIEFINYDPETGKRHGPFYHNFSYSTSYRHETKFIFDRYVEIHIDGSKMTVDGEVRPFENNGTYNMDTLDCENYIFLSRDGRMYYIVDVINGRPVGDLIGYRTHIDRYKAFLDKEDSKPYYSGTNYVWDNGINGDDHLLPQNLKQARYFDLQNSEYYEFSNTSRIGYFDSLGFPESLDGYKLNSGYPISMVRKIDNPNDNIHLTDSISKTNDIVMIRNKYVKKANMASFFEGINDDDLRDYDHNYSRGKLDFPNLYEYVHGVRYFYQIEQDEVELVYNKKNHLDDYFGYYDEYEGYKEDYDEYNLKPKPFGSSMINLLPDLSDDGIKNIEINDIINAPYTIIQKPTRLNPLGILSYFEDPKKLINDFNNQGYDKLLAMALCVNWKQTPVLDYLFEFNGNAVSMKKLAIPYIRNHGKLYAKCNLLKKLVENDNYDEAREVWNIIKSILSDCGIWEPSLTSAINEIYNETFLKLNKHLLWVKKRTQIINNLNSLKSEIISSQENKEFEKMFEKIATYDKLLDANITTYQVGDGFSVEDRKRFASIKIEYEWNSFNSVTQSIEMSTDDPKVKRIWLKDNRPLIDDEFKGPKNYFSKISNNNIDGQINKGYELMFNNASRKTLIKDIANISRVLNETQYISTERTMFYGNGVFFQLSMDKKPKNFTDLMKIPVEKWLFCWKERKGNKIGFYYDFETRNLYFFQKLPRRHFYNNNLSQKVYFDYFSGGLKYEGYGHPKLQSLSRYDYQMCSGWCIGKIFF